MLIIKNLNFEDLIDLLKNKQYYRYYIIMICSNNKNYFYYQENFSNVYIDLLTNQVVTLNSNKEIENMLKSNYNKDTCHIIVNNLKSKITQKIINNMFLVIQNYLNCKCTFTNDKCISGCAQSFQHFFYGHHFLLFSRQYFLIIHITRESNSIELSSLIELIYRYVASDSRRIYQKDFVQCVSKNYIQNVVYFYDLDKIDTFYFKDFAINSYNFLKHKQTNYNLFFSNCQHFIQKIYSFTILSKIDKFKSYVSFENFDQFNNDNYSILKSSDIMFYIYNITTISILTIFLFFVIKLISK
jgi:hypothetical protein